MQSEKVPRMHDHEMEVKLPKDTKCGSPAMPSHSGRLSLAFPLSPVVDRSAPVAPESTVQLGSDSEAVMPGWL